MGKWMSGRSCATACQAHPDEVVWHNVHSDRGVDKASLGNAHAHAKQLSNHIRARVRTSVRTPHDEERLSGGEPSHGQSYTSLSEQGHLPALNVGLISMLIIPDRKMERYDIIPMCDGSSVQDINVHACSALCALKCAYCDEGLLAGKRGVRVCAYTHCTTSLLLPPLHVPQEL
jgi:hypothetical protein